jgi:hypothetical protein
MNLNQTAYNGNAFETSIIRELNRINKEYEEQEKAAKAAKAAELKEQCHSIIPKLELSNPRLNYWIATITEPYPRINQYAFKSEKITGCEFVTPISDHVLFLQSNLSKSEILDLVENTFLPF